MYVVQTRIPVDPDSRSNAVSVAKEVTARSREEDGIVSYHATMAVGDDPVLHFFECYEDHAALEAHAETDHYETFVDGLSEYVAGEMETTQYEVAESWTSTFALDALQE